MPGRDLTLWTFFIAGIFSVAIALAAVLGALLIAQHRRIALERDHARRIFTAQEEERSRVDCHQRQVQPKHWVSVTPLEVEALGGTLE